MTGRAGITKKSAVLKALEELGTKTSLYVLSVRASEHFHGKISQEYCSLIRSKYRVEKGQSEDCRTYQTQDRRNMYSDALVPISALIKLKNFVKHHPDITTKDVTELIDILKELHSVPQILNLIPLVT